MESHNHPSLHRALSGRGDRGRRHHARRLHHGRAADRAAERPALRRSGASEDPAAGGRAWSPASAATATASACRPWPARPTSTAATTATSWSTPCAWAWPTPTRSSTPPRPAPGLPVVYFGSKTGRDGIHGATMASAEFDEDSDEKRPTVQVGDPFAEKLLIEATLELMASGAVAAIQDMGAAGLTSSSVEMAGKGGGRHRARPRRGAPARRGHERLRDDAVGEPGADAGDPQARPRGRRRGASSRNGAWTPPSSARPPTPAASCCATRARWSATCRWRR